MEAEAERALLARLAAGVARSEAEVALRAGEPSGLPDAATLRPSAVLVPIVLRVGGATLLLTRRASTLPVRGGDVVFPGGGARAGEPSVETALREAEEEVGVPAARARVLGFLDAHPTGIGFRIQPVVALVPGDFVPAPDPREVDAVYEIPLAFALDPANHRLVRVRWNDLEHEVAHIQHAGVGLWGVTASIVMELAQRSRESA